MYPGSKSRLILFKSITLTEFWGAPQIRTGAGNLWLCGAGNFEAKTVKNKRKDNLEIRLFYYNLKKW